MADPSSSLGTSGAARCVPPPSHSTLQSAQHSHELSSPSGEPATELSLHSLADMGFTDTQAQQMYDAVSKMTRRSAAKHALSTLTALLVLGLNPSTVLKLLEKCPELFYTVKESQLQQRIGNLRKLGLGEGEKCLFTIQQVTDILRDAPAIVVENLDHLEYKFQYVYFRMGVKQAEMVKSRLFRFTLDEVRHRHCFLERRGLYQTPDKKGQTTIINPKLDSVLSVDQDTFLAHVAMASSEEYDVFKRLMAREWQEEELRRGSIEADGDDDVEEEDEEDEETGGRSGYRKRRKKKLLEEAHHRIHLNQSIRYSKDKMTTSTMIANFTQDWVDILQRWHLEFFFIPTTVITLATLITNPLLLVCIFLSRALRQETRYLLVANTLPLLSPPTACAILTVTLMVADTYAAVRWPLHYHERLPPARTHRILLGVWVLAALYPFTLVIMMEVQGRKGADEVTVCLVLISLGFFSFQNPMGISIYFFVAALICATLIFYCYIRLYMVTKTQGIWQSRFSRARVTLLAHGVLLLLYFLPGFVFAIELFLFQRTDITLDVRVWVSTVNMCILMLLPRAFAPYLYGLRYREISDTLMQLLHWQKRLSRVPAS
ncbi:Transcription termination factor 4, mitochondrial [Collichthys lucidus]|uniref:Transcription termination factor 4, mitochondrial n=1 Tax=Collichthys lucidus TaxID=240159 RepID=A0A4U5V112_COLLU|nr:Transcription termination factor 4, mitochondrial [Collichthys lucidus]